MIATKQARDYESRMLNMSKEHSERITQLQTRLDYMNIEAEQQKALVMQQKHKERERLDKIGEVNMKMIYICVCLLSISRYSCKVLSMNQNL
jgi:hypothetical protein